MEYPPGLRLAIARPTGARSVLMTLWYCFWVSVSSPPTGFRSGVIMPSPVQPLSAIGGVSGKWSSRPVRWCLPEYRPGRSRQFQHGTRAPSTSGVRGRPGSSMVGMKSSEASPQARRPPADDPGGTEDRPTSTDSASSACVRLRR